MINSKQSKRKARQLKRCALTTEFIENNLDKLNQYQQYIIWGYFLSNKTLAEIGRKLGILRKQAWLIKEQALKKLTRLAIGRKKKSVEFILRFVYAGAISVKIKGEAATVHFSGVQFRYKKISGNWDNGLLEKAERAAMIYKAKHLDAWRKKRRPKRRKRIVLNYF